MIKFNLVLTANLRGRYLIGPNECSHIIRDDCLSDNCYSDFIRCCQKP